MFNPTTDIRDFLGAPIPRPAPADNQAHGNAGAENQGGQPGIEGEIIRPRAARLAAQQQQREEVQQQQLARQPGEPEPRIPAQIAPRDATGRLLNGDDALLEARGERR